MSTEPDYVAVLKATYDYEPQSEDEISIKENQIVLLIERVDDDWWKVKIKGDSQDDETPMGLVPAAWLETADHSSAVKAIYDYAASAPGELSISEDEILLAFDTEEEWMLVQSTKEGGKAGYVPANYVEPHNEEEEAQAVPQIVVPPSSPPRPVSTYVDPADRVASTKTNDVNDADQIKTWSVAEVDQKGKKMKGTLGIGKGAVFFASETSKAAVRRWPSTDIVRVTVEKNKHLHIDIGGSTPTSLHFNVGSRDNVDAIKDKLQLSKVMSLAVSSPAVEETSEAETHESVSQKGRKPSVHFSAESPVIIPTPDIDGDEEALDTEEESGESAVALYDFNADQSDELTVKEGEHLLVIEKDDEWWKCRNAEGVEGVVPASYVEIRNAEDAENNKDEEDEDRRIREEQVAAAAAQAVAAQEAAQMRAKQAQAQAAEAKKLKEAKEKEERARKEAEKKAKSEQKAKAAAEEERARLQAQKEAESRRKSSPDERSEKQNGRSSSDTRDDHYRLWHDRTGQFSTEAVFLGFSDGKVSLRKKNGVVVYVPSERMSAEDMRYIDKFVNRKRSSRPQSSPSRLSEDDIPLGLQHPNPNGKTRAQPPASRGSTTDWFDFFLSAGCDMNDCTRYAASFERDKIDESILPDITESTMRSLGLREGDIIRVTKAIAARKPQVKKNDVDMQILRDEELARRLDAEEKAGTKSPPNIFTGPGGALKPRRTRPTPSKTLPPNVDLNLIGNISDRASSPQQGSPANRPSSTPVQPPPRSSSAIPTASGFEDDAWTNRTKPMTPTPSSSAATRPPSAPPAPVVVPVTAAPAPQPAATPAAVPSSPAAVSSSQAAPAYGLAQTTEADIFDQLSRLGELRKTTPAVPSPTAPVASTVVSPPPPPPPVGLQNGLGVGSSPSPIGQFLQGSQPPQQPSPQPYNGPRGPFAPVPVNQGLLQPLVPTQTGFNSFIPTRASTNAVSPFQNPPSQPSFLASQPTGFPGMQPILSQPTGLPFSGLQPIPNGFGQVATNPTGFNPNFGQAFNNVSSVPPVPPIPSPAANSTSPANIFAQMKSGTFATDHDTTLPQTAEKYDALRPNPLIPQATGWGTYGYR